MVWMLLDGFRNTSRLGAYCPVWAHAVEEGSENAIYAALYREAATQWHAAGCQVHALTLLAHDQVARDFWFWNGFGSIAIDAIRSTKPIGVQPPQHLTIRKAEIEDAKAIAMIEAEHWRHYAQPRL